MKQFYDITIIGAGVVGAALAYRLSRYDLNILWLEKENDVSMGESRANTAIIHGGYDPDPETLMGKLNVRGMELCFELCDKLDVEVKKSGSFVVAFGAEDEQHLHLLYERGLKNGVRDMELWGPEKIQKAEPHLSKEITKALWVPNSGVVNPWELTLAMGEVAVRNGVELRLNQKVTDIEPGANGYRIRTQDQQYQSDFVVNAAGVFSDEIHAMVAPLDFAIIPTRGEYYLLDRTIGPIVHSVIFQCPTAESKGVLVSPTIHDNILVGPNSEVIADKSDTAVTATGLSEVSRAAKRSVPDLDLRYSIRNYAGIRANSNKNDFDIRFIAPHFLNLAAIKSPGLTCAPSIAEYAEKLLSREGLELQEKDNFKDGRKVVRVKHLNPEQRAELIRKNPLYGRVICRCETITEGEIVDAIQREIPPISLDGIKRRCGTGMGRCQGGFCGPKVLEIIARERAVPPPKVMNDAAGSYILTERTKEVRKHA